MRTLLILLMLSMNCLGQSAPIGLQTVSVSPHFTRTILDPQFANELELGVQQRKLIFELQVKMQKENTRRFPALPPEELTTSQNDDQRFDERKVEMAEWHKTAGREIAVALEGILSKKQIRRTVELLVWEKLNNGMLQMMSTEPVKSILGDLVKTKDFDKQFVFDLRHEFDQELDELKKQYRRKLNEELSEKQLKKLEDLLGKPSSIDYHPEGNGVDF